jgi:hypothetical protein
MPVSVSLSLREREGAAQRKEALRVRILFEKLLRAKVFQFPEQGQAIEASTKHGVYIIYDKKWRVCHVGRTVRGCNGIYQRLNNHLSGSSSFACDYIKNPDYEKNGLKGLRMGYSYQFIEIDDPRIRALVESLAAGELCPRHMGTGQSRF